MLKNCQLQSYGFQNFISSRGSWSKISKLRHVGDVKDFCSKSSFFNFTNTWEAFFAQKYQFLIFLWLFIFIEDFIKDFTKDFNKDFTKGFPKDFTNEFVVRLFYKDFTKNFTTDFNRILKRILKRFY